MLTNNLPLASPCPQIPLFSLDAVRFLDFDPSGQAGPYGTCPESLTWLSEDQAVFRAAMHNIDVRLDRWPRKVRAHLVSHMRAPFAACALKNFAVRSTTGRVECAPRQN